MLKKLLSIGKIFFFQLKAHRFAIIGILPLGLVDLIIDDVLDLLYLFPYKWVNKGIIPLDMAATYMEEVKREAPIDLINIKSNRVGENTNIRISIL